MAKAKSSIGEPVVSRCPDGRRLEIGTEWADIDDAAAQHLKEAEKGRVEVKGGAKDPKPSDSHETPDDAS